MKSFNEAKKNVSFRVLMALLVVGVFGVVPYACSQQDNLPGSNSTAVSAPAVSAEVVLAEAVLSAQATAFATQVQANADAGFFAQRTLCGRIDKVVQRGAWRRDKVWENITRNLVTAEPNEARKRVLTELRNRTNTQTASDGDLPGRVYEAMSSSQGGACQHSLNKGVDLYFMVDVQKNVTDPALRDRFDDFLKKRK